MAAPDIVVEVRLPASIYHALHAEGYDRSKLSSSAVQSLAARLYSEHRLSIGQAAQMAGMPIIRFMDLLNSLGLPVVEYGEEEYEQDMKTLARLRERESQ